MRTMTAAYYEIICTHSGEVGAVYQFGNTRVLVEHVLPGRGVDDLALSILAHHFQVSAKRARDTIQKAPMSTDEKLLDRLFPPFRDNFIMELEVPHNGSIKVTDEDIGNWCHHTLKSGKLGPW